MTGPNPIEKRATKTPSFFATRKCPTSCMNTSTPRGTADTAYSVSPRRRAKMTGPNPIEKRCTKTPTFFATRKCPSSCTNTSTPRATTKEISVTAKYPMFMITPFVSHPRQHRVIVCEDHRKQEAVQPIQDATVSRDNPAGVLGTEGAFQRRFAQVAELREKADRHPEYERLARAELREEDDAAERRNEHGTGERPERPLDRLARAHRRRELVPPEGAAAEIPARVRAHRGETGDENPAFTHSRIELAQQHEVR